jgi:multidrug efflux system membrane fusion protein
MRLTSILSVSIAAALLLGIAGCERNATPQAALAAATARPPAPVTAAVAIARDVPVYLDEIGHITPVESVTVMPQVAGRITAVHFTEGSDVKKGDLLFELDARPFQAQLAKDEATLATNREVTAQAQREFERVEALKDTAAVPKTEYDQKKSAVATAEAQVKWAQAAVEQSKLNLEYCTIKSPIDGRTGARMVDPGNIVKANETPLVLIQRLTPIYADFTITEKDLPAVRHNMATGTLRTEVSIPNDVAEAATKPTTLQSTTTPVADNSARVGELTFLDNRVQDGTGNVRLRATLQNSDRHFWPGQFVNVRLILSVRKDAVLIPQRAIQIGQQGPYVYVVKPDSSAELRLVTPGQDQGDLVMIEKGLDAGERVIVTGQLAVTPGGKVHVEEPLPAGGPTKTASSDQSNKSETEGSRS